MGKRSTSPGQERFFSVWNWKFWLLVAATALWCGLFGMAMTGGLKRPSMTRWWADRIAAEDGVPSIPPTHPVISTDLRYPRIDGHLLLGFDNLDSFPANPPVFDSPRMDPRLKTKQPSLVVPDYIQKLDNQAIAITGFLIPMAVQNDKAHSFILAQSRGSCCYGITPKINQWIYVTMEKGKEVDPVMDIPVTVFGILSVDPQVGRTQNDWCLYRMTGEKVDLPKKVWF